ncbi:MAG: hypothetical protein OHK0046_28700 [Anaerolineae bacterium]
MPLKNDLKIAWQHLTAATFSVLNVPHDRPRDEIRRRVAAIDPAQLEAQRIRLIADATGRSEDDVRAIVAAYAREPWAAISLADASRIKLYGMPEMDRVTLYTLVWAQGAHTSVETGAASGMSAMIILSYLAAQQAGRLISVDVETPENPEYGGLIPAEFRPWWELRLQRETPVLPEILGELGEIDFFLHDSVHTAKHMLWEYELAWPYIKAGGCLASHDVYFSTAFDAFRQKYAGEISSGGMIGNFGFVIKGVRDEHYLP